MPVSSAAYERVHKLLLLMLLLFWGESSVDSLKNLQMDHLFSETLTLLRNLFFFCYVTFLQVYSKPPGGRRGYCASRRVQTPAALG